MLLWLEMTLYAVTAALASYLQDWLTRAGLLCAITAFFGLLTYLFTPYTEEADRWFDFTGRVMIIGTFAGLYACSAVTPGHSHSDPLFFGCMCRGDG